MSSRVDVSEANCNQCLYATCCEYGLTHHPTEMCKQGMELYQQNIVRGNRAFMHTVDDFSGIKSEELESVGFRLEGKDTYEE